jgi:hypothetical protein
MSKSQSARSIKPARLSAALGLALLGCTQEVREVPPPDCSVEDAYEFLPLFPAPDPATNWFAAGDTNAKLPGTLAYDDIVDFNDPICEHTVGKTFSAGHNYEWGSVAGRWQRIGPEQKNASAYEGLSFWGLTKYDPSVEMILSDIASATPDVTTANPDTPVNGECLGETRLTPDPNDDPMATEANPKYIDANGIPVANACGSAFSRRIVMSRSWKLYTLPFSDFYQNALDPRFKPGGLDTSQILLLTFRVPKDAFIEDTFVNFAWYRKKPTP